MVCAPSRALLATLHQTVEVVACGIMLGRSWEGSLMLCCFDGGFQILFSHRAFLPMVNSEPNLQKFVCVAALRGLLHSNCLSFLTKVCCYGFGHVYRDAGGVLQQSRVCRCSFGWLGSGCRNSQLSFGFSMGVSLILIYLAKIEGLAPSLINFVSRV